MSEVELIESARSAAEADAVCVEHERDVSELSEAAEHLIELSTIGRDSAESLDETSPVTLGLVRSEADSVLARVGSELPALTATESEADNKAQMVMTLEAIGTKVKEIWNALVAALKKMWEAFKAFLTRLFDRVRMAVDNMGKKKIEKDLFYILPAVVVHKLYPKGDAATRWKEFNNEFNAQSTAVRQLGPLAFSPLVKAYHETLGSGFNIDSTEELTKQENAFSVAVNTVAKALVKPLIPENDLIGEFTYAENKMLDDGAPLTDRIKNLAKLNVIVNTGTGETDLKAKGVEIRATGVELEEMGKVAQVLLKSYETMMAMFSDQASFSVLSKSVVDFNQAETENTVRNVNAVSRITTALDQTFYELGRMNLAYMTDIVINYTYLVSRAEAA